MARIAPPDESQPNREHPLDTRQRWSESVVADDVEVSLDVVFEILKNRRRRWLLAYLRETDGIVHLRDLAEELAARENDTSVAAVTSTERKRTYVALYQTHLPKLDDLGVVEYDSRAGYVEPTDRTNVVLSVVEQSTDSRSWYAYGGLGAGTTALFTMNYLALLPFHIASSVFSGIVITTFLSLSLVQRGRSR